MKDSLNCFNLDGAIARRFAAEGARVVMLDPRSEPIEGGEYTVDLITETGGQTERLHN